MCKKEKIKHFYKTKLWNDLSLLKLISLDYFLNISDISDFILIVFL